MKKNTRMKTSISSKAFCSQTDGQNIYRIYANMQDESAQKKIDLYLNYRMRKSRFLLNLEDKHTDIQTDGHSSYRVASLLKTIISNFTIVKLKIHIFVQNIENVVKMFILRLLWR